MYIYVGLGELFFKAELKMVITKLSAFIAQESVSVARTLFSENVTR